MMRRLPLRLLPLFALSFVLMACSGSEETQTNAVDNEHEFTHVDDADKPTIPQEYVDEDNPRMPQEPAVTFEEAPAPHAWTAPPQEKPREQTNTTVTPAQTEPYKAPEHVTVPAQQPQTTRPATASGLLMWSVQIGAFKDDAGAVRLVEEAKSKLTQPIYKDYDPVTGFFKVTAGSFTTQEQASQYKMDVRTAGFPDAFTVEVRR